MTSSITGLVGSPVWNSGYNDLTPVCILPIVQLSVMCLYQLCVCLYSVSVCNTQAIFRMNIRVAYRGGGGRTGISPLQLEVPPTTVVIHLKVM
jgi:hypothetical protein